MSSAGDTVQATDKKVSWWGGGGARNSGFIDFDPCLRDESCRAPLSKTGTYKWFLMPPLSSTSCQPLPANLGIYPGLLSVVQVLLVSSWHHMASDWPLCCMSLADLTFWGELQPPEHPPSSFQRCVLSRPWVSWSWGQVLTAQCWQEDKLSKTDSSSTLRPSGLRSTYLQIVVCAKKRTYRMFYLGA